MAALGFRTISELHSRHQQPTKSLKTRGTLVFVLWLVWCFCTQFAHIETHSKLAITRRFARERGMNDVGGSSVLLELSPWGNKGRIGQIFRQPIGRVGTNP